MFPFSSGEKAHNHHPPSSLERTDSISAVLAATEKHFLTGSLVLHFYTEAECLKQYSDEHGAMAMSGCYILNVHIQGGSRSV